MKSFFRLIFALAPLIFILRGNLWAQTSDMHQLRQKLKTFEQQKNPALDTSYLNTKNSIAFLNADRYPDSALLDLPQIIMECRAAKYGEGETDALKITGNAYQTKGDFEKALEYYEKAEVLAEKINYTKSLPGILGNIGLVYMNQGNYPVALQKFYTSMQRAEAAGDKLVVRSNLNNIGTIHFYQGKMNEAEEAYRKTLSISEQIADTDNIILAYNNIGEVNLEQHNTTAALQNLTIANKLAGLKYVPQMLVAVNNSLGDCYLKMDSAGLALQCFNRALQVASEQANARGECKALIGLARVKNKLGKFKEAQADGLKALDIALKMGQAQLLRDAYEIIATIYENTGDGNSALGYYRKYKMYSDSLQNLESEQAAANYKAQYAFSKKELEFERKTLQQRWLIFSAFAALITLSIFFWFIYRNKKRLNKHNKDLHLKNELIKAEKLKAENTLHILKETQSQLIQSEKMASLGELTASIAHEIQNPLNFVNNFSEINKELLAEMNEEIKKGNMDEVNAIAADVISNEEKINHHGKRADAIVKGMLQHSRSTNNATKEPADINKLADEYLRLAYHGLRAKDKSFNATMKTDYDESIGNINIIPQDIGRVILNLITNAFYVVNEKSKQNNAGYEPTVSIATSSIQPPEFIPQKAGGGRVVQIKVSDNGGGIPQKILDKIFQPFFTTKPTGQGTGLGLSLSYDIVKAHGGELRVETKEGEGTEFIILLPV
jgi:two-component system, NtrC family, sensor kinase